MALQIHLAQAGHSLEGKHAGPYIRPYLGPYDGPREGALFDERGIPADKAWQIMEMVWEKGHA